MSGVSAEPFTFAPGLAIGISYQYMGSSSPTRSGRGVAGPPLRLGILVNDVAVPWWAASTVHNLVASKICCLELVVRNRAFRKYSNLERARRLRPRKFLYHAYREFLFRPSANVPFDLSAVVAEVPVLDVATDRRGRYSEYFPADAVAQMRDFKLDVMLRFGFGIIRGDILSTATYGVWSFHFDDEQRYRGGPPCFWEVYNSDPFTGAMLQCLTERLDSGIILRKAFFPTVPGNYRANFDQVAFACVTWPLEVCRDIVNGCAEYLDGPASQTRAPVFRSPRNGTMLKFGARIAATRLALFSRSS
jgi:hypothetical protein